MIQTWQYSRCRKHVASFRLTAARDGVKAGPLSQLSQNHNKLQSKLKHLRHQTFHCEQHARRALERLDHSLKYHRLYNIEVVKVLKYQGKVRPKTTDTPAAITYQAYATSKADESGQNQVIQARSCYVPGTSIFKTELSAPGIITAYKHQNAAIERGFRFLKNPYFFAFSLFC